MRPTFDQIKDAAYLRWQGEGYGHGHDREDWLAAEQDLLFALNYEVAAHYRLDDSVERFVGERGRRVCRYCERSAPQARFQDRRPAFPRSLGNESLFTLEECDECHDLFREALGEELESFTASLFRKAPGGAAWASPRRAIPLPALKGLAKLALSIMPRGDLDGFVETIEWVCNPDHDFDARLFGGLGCYVHDLRTPFAHPWTALTRRVEDVPMPSMLFFLGLRDVTLELPVPLGAGDEDLDGDAMIVPRVNAPSGVGHAPRASTSSFLPLSASDSESRGSRQFA